MKQTLALTLLFAMTLTIGALSASAQSPQLAVTQAGVRTCLTCHGSDPKVTAILQTPMAVMGDRRTPFAQGGCESCHGNSAAHSAGKARFPAIVFRGPNASPIAVRNEVCSGCHEGGIHINWQGSAHEVNNVACTDCHDPHAAKDPMLVRTAQAEACFTCHATQRADSFKYSHHPMREGTVVCSDCHNPHGSPGDTKLLKEFTVNQTCYNCHADKRGPMLWEHQPVRDNCLNCHNPHGSTQPRLVKEQMNFLCSSCHSASAANHSGGAFGGRSAIPFRGPGNFATNSALANQRACVGCHSQVHGSNSPAGTYFFRWRNGRAKEVEMITRNALRCVALATTCLAPLAARADDPAVVPTPQLFPNFPATHGEIEVDLGGVMGNNANQAGRYTGLNSTGPIGGISEFDLNARAPWNSGDVRFFELDGRNLIFHSSDHLGTGLGSDHVWASSVNNGLANNGSLEFKGGDQGIWEAGITYDAITYTGNVIDSLYNVTGPTAVLNHGLVPWGGATTTRAGAITSYTVPRLNATGAMLPFQTGVRRDLIGGNFKVHWDDWTFKGAISHEHKSGSMEDSFYGPWGGTAFGLPINYDTERYDLSAAYTTHHLQALFQYTFSHFTDNVSFVNLPYPTSNTAAPFQRSAAYSTPPSNDAHYLTFMVGTDVVPLTHINLNGRVGLEMQSDTFAPNTADPSPSGAGLNSLNSLGQGTTASSPNMMADIYQLRLSAASRPLKNVDTRVYYGLDGRSVTLNQYRVYAGGSGGGAADAAAAPLVGSTLLFAVPQDWFKQNAGFDVGYRILPEHDTKVTAGYRLDSVTRSNAQVGRSWTNTGTLAVGSAFGSQVNGKLSFDYVNRSGSLSYITPWFNLTGDRSPTYSGAYYQAPMTSESVTLRADYSPTENLSGSLYVRFRNENFTYPAATLAGTDPGTVLPLSGTGQGIRQDYSLSAGPDINYRPTGNLNLHFFYTYEQLYYDNLGNGQCSVAPITALCTGTVGSFRNQDTSSTHTVGLSGDWKVNEKLRLRAEYTLSYGTVMFGEFDGVFVPVATQSFQNLSNYPDINSLMNNVRVTATYQLMPNIELVALGMYTSFHNNDWNDTANAVQGAGGTAISFLTPGYAAPNYNIVALLAGVKFRF